MSARSPYKRFARSTERWARRALARLIERPVVEPPPIRVDDVTRSWRILLIRPNFRIGNAAISTSLIACFRARFPQARIDFLATDQTRDVLLCQPVTVIYTLSRRGLRRPWRYLSLLRELRRNSYDLAVQANATSLTGALILRLVRARSTMGRGEGHRRRYNLEVFGAEVHAYDNALNFARALGGSCPDRPDIHLGEAECQAAREHLRALATPWTRHQRFCALFAGGHAEKRWSLENWLALILILEKNRHPFILFLGPEERHIEDRLRGAMANYRYGALVGPRPLREFCALLSFALCLITPDSGPMHLAAGLDVPVIALVRAPISLGYVPRGECDLALIDPTPAQVYEILIESGRSRACGRREKSGFL